MSDVYEILLAIACHLFLLAAVQMEQDLEGLLIDSRSFLTTCRVFKIR